MKVADLFEHRLRQWGARLPVADAVEPVSINLSYYLVLVARWFGIGFDLVQRVGT